ncbi:MAG: DUF748 domain-containing protein, partial [Candidatus Atribacteria bacterium]|nr:DUF748 domain-containing protein [Candidatus Atribacteria bacterium]
MVDSKFKKRLVSFFILSVFIILALMGLVYLYINTENFQTKIKTILITQLENSFDKRIEIGSVDSISFQSLSFNHLTVFDDKTHEQDNILFQAEQVKAKFTLVLSLFHWENWHLNIHDITFNQASATVTRELNGEFDFIKKLNFDPERIQQNFSIHQIHFQNSKLTFQDKMIYHYSLEYLTTKAKNINGYFDFSSLPKIVLDFQGKQENDLASLALSGSFLINQPEYSLDFKFRNAEITHFQYYLEASEEFQISQGKFDLDLWIGSSPKSNPVEIFWQGKATFQQANAKPQFLKQVPFDDISGSVQFTKPEITITEMNGLYDGKTAGLKGFVLTEPKISFDLDIEGEKIDSTQLKNDIGLFIPNYTKFSLQGELDLSGKVKGDLEKFQIEGKISSQEIVFEGLSLQKSDCSFLLNDQALTIHSFNSYDQECLLSLNGQIDWPEGIPYYNLTVQTKDLNMQHPLLKQTPFFGGISGNINSRFQIESQKQNLSVLDIGGQFTLNSTRIKELALLEPIQGTMTAEYNFPNKILKIKQGELKSGQKEGFIKGEVRLNDPTQLTIDFGCSMLELNELVTLLGLETEIQLSGKTDIQGKVYTESGQQNMNAELRLQELSVQGNLLGNLTGEVEYQENTLTLENINLTNQDVILTGSGKVYLNEMTPPEIELSYHFDQMAIDPIIQKMMNMTPSPLSGQMTGHGQIQGAWPELTLQGNLQLEEIVCYDYPLGDGQLDFTLQPEKGVKSTAEKNHPMEEKLIWPMQPYSLKIEDFSLKNESLELRTTGQLNIREDYPFSLDIEFLHHDFHGMIEGFYDYDSFYKNFLPTEIMGNARLVSNASEQQISLTAQLIPKQKENNPPSQLELALIRNDEGLAISDFQLIQSEGYLEAEGKIDSNQEMDIHFQAKQLDMNRLMDLVQFGETIQGIMDLEGNCKGTIDQPQIFMNAQIKKGYFRDFKFDNLQSNLFWNCKTNEIEVRELAIALEDDYQIQAKGNLPIDTFINRTQKDADPNTLYQEIPLNFQITTKKADLKILKLVWKDAFSEIMGSIDLELNLSGTAGNPLVNGNAKIHQGQIIFEQYPIRLENLNTIIEVSDNQMM